MVCGTSLSVYGRALETRHLAREKKSATTVFVHEFRTAQLKSKKEINASRYVEHTICLLDD